MKKTFSTKIMILIAFFAALTGVLSQIAIPIPPVPINLAMFSVFLAGSLLGSKYGALSQLIYVLLGAIGLPVFSSFSSGIGIIVGPTGGYIIGYIVAAWVTGWIISKIGRKHVALIIAITTGLLLCYTLGTSWFMFITKTSLLQSLTLCVFPFLIGDAIKIIVASILTPILNRHITY